MTSVASHRWNPPPPPTQSAESNIIRRKNQSFEMWWRHIITRIHPFSFCTFFVHPLNPASFHPPPPPILSLPLFFFFFLNHPYLFDPARPSFNLHVLSTLRTNRRNFFSGTLTDRPRFDVRPNRERTRWNVGTFRHDIFFLPPHTHTRTFAFKHFYASKDSKFDVVWIVQEETSGKVCFWKRCE